MASSSFAAAPATPQMCMPQTLMFPFKSIPKDSWRGGHRYFGAPRANGRLHAGCDLIFPVGTAIFAMADGVVMRGPYPFYEKTNALEVLHAGVGLIMRYGELRPGSTPRELRQAGAKVTAGQLIGEVGQLIDNLGHSSHSSMLHIEMYTDIFLDSVAHPLTVRNASGGKMQRRADVTDPAPYLDIAAKTPAGAP